MQINVCLATDENYLKYMATSMVSILKTANKTDDLCFYILCNKISNDSKDYIKSLKKIKNFSIDFLDINIKDFIDFPRIGPHISNTGYFRYKIAELCHNISKIIYLDCDVIVKQSLTELFETDIGDYYLAGVEDVGYYYWREKNPKFIYKNCFYINTGVLLINLEVWRQNNLYNKLVDFTIKEADKIEIGDQDVINAVCKGKIKELDYKWNVQDSFYRKKPERCYNPNCSKIIEASKNPAIIHYTNIKKPWNDKKMARSLDWCYYNYKRIGENYTFKFIKEILLIYIYIFLFILKHFIKFVFNVKTIRIEEDYKIVKILFFKIKRKNI